MKTLRQLSVEDFKNPEMRKTIENNVMLYWENGICIGDIEAVYDGNRWELINIGGGDVNYTDLNLSFYLVIDKEIE